MIQHLYSRSKPRRAPVHNFVERSDCRNDLRLHFFRRNSPGHRRRRRFSSFRQISNVNDDHRLHAILPADFRCQWLVSRQHAPESLGRTRVRQVQMLQDFCRAPFLRLVPAQLLGRQSRDRRLNLPPQFFQVMVHGVPLNFFRLSDRMLPQL